MRKYLSILLVLLLTFSFVMSEAQAKRFGGGRSFGVSRSVSSFSRNQTLSSPQRGLPSNPWMNRLMGLALGGILAYLLMGNGLASGIFSWLIIGGVVLLLVNLIRNKMQAAAQPNAYSAARGNPLYDAPSRFMDRNTYANATDSTNHPVGFDSEAFLRNAKTQFVELQAAYDQKNLNQLREFTTPEIFSEIQYQLRERGEMGNITEVVTLDAVVLDVATEPKSIFDSNQTTVVSVRFSGMIREEINAAAVAFNEIWHFQQDINNARWLVAGIQQN